MPPRIFETLEAFRRTAALRAAIELDIFTAIAEGTNTFPIERELPLKWKFR